MGSGSGTINWAENWRLRPTEAIFGRIEAGQLAFEADVAHRDAPFPRFSRAGGTAHAVRRDLDDFGVSVSISLSDAVRLHHGTRGGEDIEEAFGRPGKAGGLGSVQQEDAAVADFIDPGAALRAHILRLTRVDLQRLQPAAGENVLVEFEAPIKNLNRAV